MAYHTALAERPGLTRQVAKAAVLPRSRRFSVPAAESSVPVVRHQVLGLLRSWGLPDTEEAGDTVELVLSELTTNAVQHACGPTRAVTVALQARPDGLLRLGVTDDSPGTPMTCQAGADAESGRGLAIAEMLTAELDGAITVERHPDGSKTVWAHFPGVLPSSRVPAAVAGAPA